MEIPVVKQINGAEKACGHVSDSAKHDYGPMDG